MDPFRGRSAIVTGGASGIGRALSTRLAAGGARVVVADVDGDGARRVATEIGGTSVQVDVRDAEAVQALVDDVADRHGSIDLLFNHAGISLGGVTHELTTAHWDRIIDINLRGVVNGVVAAYPRMVAQRSGHIVNTTSPTGLVGTPFTVAYGATKHAITGLTASLRPEARAHGVRVSLLVPGSIDTPIQDSQQPADLPPRPSDVLTGREFLKVVGATKLMDPDAFAAKALRGVAHNRAIVMVPGSIKPLWYLHRLSPAAIERLGRVIVRRVQREIDARLRP